MNTQKDEFYRDLLEGLAIYSDNAFQRDVLTTLSRYDVPALGAALNKNQISSKMWLADALFETVGGKFETIAILGGWFGVLGAVLLHDRRFAIGKIVSLDIDPTCAPIAESVNGIHARSGRFAAATADMTRVVYGSAPNDARGGVHAELIVNTSCEHLSEFGRWYERIPAGQLLALQSNDYASCGEHVNCVPNLDAFLEQAPMREVLYAGERKLKRYVRFMLIGRR